MKDYNLIYKGYTIKLLGLMFTSQGYNVLIFPPRRGYFVLGTYKTKTIAIREARFKIDSIKD
jgi:hypothetical protein